MERATEAWAIIHSLVVARRHRIPEVAAELGITPGDVFALLSLLAEEPKPMRDLAEAWRCDASNVTWQVDRLEERGFVERRSVEADRRVKQVALTPAGLEAQARVLAFMHVPPDELLNLGPELLDQLIGVLSRIDPGRQPDCRPT